jgi:glycosyltransferase involved in cell wall biosynthesis
MSNEITGLVSVIIPTFNRAALCKYAVESVLAQTYRNLEVIVVDDGSVDDTRELLAGLDERVRYLWQRNAGVSASRNLGIESAQGEFLTFLDSDDSWLPWKLEAQLAVLKAYPNAGMVFTDMAAVGDDQVMQYESYKARMFDAYETFSPETHFQHHQVLGAVWDGCPLELGERRCHAGDIVDQMFLGNLVLTSSVVIRRSRQQAVGLFDVSLLRSGEDYDFHLRTCNVGEVAYVDVSAVRYRIGAEDQLTSRDLLIWIARNDLKTVTKMLSTSRDRLHWSDIAVRRRLARAYAWVGLEEFARSPKFARQFLWRSLQLFPNQPRSAIFLLLSILPLPVIALIKAIKTHVMDKGLPWLRHIAVLPKGDTKGSP